MICCRKIASEWGNMCRSVHDTRKIPFVVGTNLMHRCYRVDKIQHNVLILLNCCNFVCSNSQ